MANPYPLETLRGTAVIHRHQIATLIGDLSRAMNLLTADIEQDEERVDIRDIDDPAYPVLARSLRKRRENIGATIASLQGLVRGVAKAA
jgi:hypothetical protein